jgi:hypothetical protein
MIAPPFYFSNQSSLHHLSIMRQGMLAKFENDEFPSNPQALFATDRCGQPSYTQQRPSKPHFHTGSVDDLHSGRHPTACRMKGQTEVRFVRSTR